MSASRALGPEWSWSSYRKSVYQDSWTGPYPTSRERREQFLCATRPERHRHLAIQADRTREMFARVVVLASMLVRAREPGVTMRGQWPQGERLGKGECLLQLPFGTIVRRRRCFMQRHLTQESPRHCLGAGRGVARGEFERAGSESARAFDTADEQQGVSESSEDDASLRRRGHGRLPVGRLVQDSEGFGLTASQRVRFGKEGRGARSHHRESVFSLNV